MTVLLPLEIKHREFHSKIFLASQILKKTKFDVVIGEKNKVINVFKNNKNTYLLSKGGPKPRFTLQKKKFNKNFIGILDEEGPLDFFDPDEMKTRVHKDVLKNLDDYFVWGKKDLKKGNNVFKKFHKILSLYGHPKYDILKKKNLSFYQNDVNKIKKKYKKFIFVSSSFRADQVIRQFLFDKYRFSNFELGKNEAKIKKEFLEYLNNEKDNYILLIKLLLQIAKKNKKINIIFRPHPRQNINLVKKRFSKKPKNLHIVYEGVITPWIIASDLYFHSGCTSFTEAACLRKKIICFITGKSPPKSKKFKNTGYFFSDYKKCLNFINSRISRGKFNFKRSKIPSGLLENSYKKDFCSLFVNHINLKYYSKLNKIKLIKEKINPYKKHIDRILVSIKRLLLSNNFFASIISFINPNRVLTYEYKKKKFSSLRYNEIKEYLYRSVKDFKVLKKIKIIKLSEDLFLLKKIKI